MKTVNQYALSTGCNVSPIQFLFTAKLVLLTVLLSFILTAQVKAADDWVKLGDRFVSLDTDKDVIPVTLLKGAFGKIKLKVKGNDIFIKNVTVIYSTGAPDRLAVLGLLREGKETRTLDLRGGNRHIKSIELTYKRIPNFKGMAEVTVYGQQN